VSDTFVSPVAFEFPVLASPTAQTVATRLPIPFNYELIGAWATVSTAVGSGATAPYLQIDLLVSAVNATGKVSVFGGLSANLMTIKNSNYDTLQLYTPTVTGDVSSYLEGPIADPGGSVGTGQTVAQENATAWGTGYQPGVLAPGTYPNDFGDLTTPASQSAGSPWAQPSGSSPVVTPYLGAAGDVFQMKVANADSTSTAVGLLVILFVTKR
jgi:hypothetical protein